MLKYYLAPWKKYADFKGRAQRAEYWVFGLGNFIIMIALGIISAVIGDEQAILILIYILVTMLPNLSVSVRRLHDTGRSAWWMFINIIPLAGGIWFFVLTVLDSKPGTNIYGPNPKEGKSQTPHQTNLPEGVRMS